MSDGGTRREFLRGLFGRAKEAAASGIPDALADAARAHTPREPAPVQPAAPPSPLTPAELERAFGVPADQRDIAESLVRLGHLTPAPD